MRAPFGGRAIDDAVRLENDRHDHRIVLIVLLSLAALAVLWTDWLTALPIPGLQGVLDHSQIGRSFEDGGLAQEIWVTYTPTIWGGQNERRLLLGAAALAFLLAYYLPLKLKKVPLVLVTLALVGIVLGPRTLGVLGMCHALAYATFHPAPASSRRALGVAASLASGLGLALVPGAAIPRSSVAEVSLAEAMLPALLVVLLASPLFWLLYARLYVPLLETEARKVLQAAVAHSSVLVLFGAVGWQAATGVTAPQILGLVVFFWQWERLIMYYLDLRHGKVPVDLSPVEYLAAFFSPAFLANFNWIVTIGKGYAYISNSFLARDKNRIVLSGLSLIASSVLFFALRPQALAVIAKGFAMLGVPVYTSFDAMLGALDAGQELSAASAWCGLIVEFFSFYLLWTGVAHFKVGLWRLFGYDLEPYFQKPFKATNILELWRRYAFYYREFLLQAFYYPVFFRFFRNRPYLRVFSATLFALGFGHFVYGHMVEGFLYDGPTTQELFSQLRTAPFYLAFGLVLALTAVWMQWRGRRRRRPWAPGWRFGLDALAMVATFGTFILLRMFRPSLASWDLDLCLRLAATALGF